VKQSMLSTGDREALQGMLQIAVGLGVATLFALFFARQRESGIAIFEVSMIVGVLTLLALTATACITAVHEGRAIGPGVLTAVAMPLAAAAFILVFAVTFARLPGSLVRVLGLFPFALAACLGIAELAISTWPERPGDSSLVGILIFGVAALMGAGAAGVDRFLMGSNRRGRVKELVRLGSRGYSAGELRLGPGLPRRPGAGEPPLVNCWMKRGRAYLDIDSCEVLRKEVNHCWRAFTRGEGRQPLGAITLARVRILYRIPGVRSDVAVRLETVEGGRELRRSMSRNDDGLFDATEILQLEVPAQA
jgi:hypothetical protein